MESPSSVRATEHVTHVADYYDANTRRFLRFGETSDAAAIHRCVWMPDAATTADAADTVNRLVIDRLRGVVPAGDGHVLDLGCGVGATMVRLATALDAQVTGVTISPVQADLAARRFEAEGLTQRCRVHCADYARLPAEPHYDAMVGIESMVHSPSMGDLVTSLAARLRPGGRIVVCDDWMTDRDRGRPARERCLAQFRAGWRIGSLHTVAEFAAMAETAGLRLVEDLDLTPYLRLGRPRDRVIDLVVNVTGALPGVHGRLVGTPFWANMIGGSALQAGLSRRWIEYHLLVLEGA
ncbi:methyltransferase domain-containing protein [Micromonospora sp. NBS 11-29]|uniref:methyltransferase domain-containing protein n=1 Tax=Micromonospora sp. NBS 11-29 TaxID=1960879 RepID=UPI000B784D1B|nr:methyltransferase domain-containing protein [Micromonospora sp. NBS 11-29]